MWFGKYMLIRNLLAFMILINIIFSLTLYEYIAIDPSNYPSRAKLISVITTIFTSLIILIWILGIYTYSELKKEKLILNRTENFIIDYGVKKFMVVFMALIIHPVSFTVDK